MECNLRVSMRKLPGQNTFYGWDIVRDLVEVWLCGMGAEGLVVQRYLI